MIGKIPRCYFKVSTASNVQASTSIANSGGSYYGGSGSGGSSGSSTSSSTANVGADIPQLAALTATTKAEADSVKAAQEQNLAQYQAQVKANNDIYDDNVLANKRDANNEWYIQQQKLQNVYGAMRDAQGMSAYNGGGDALNYLTRLSDDIADQQLLNAEQKNQANLNETLYNSNVEAANAYNQSLRDTKNAYGNLMNDYIVQWGNLVGSSTKADSDTSYTSDSSTSTSNSTTTSNANDYISNAGDAKNASININALREVFGKDAGMENGDTNFFGSYVDMPELQRARNVRAASDTDRAASLAQVYGNRARKARY